jgi:hypothetical protein
MQCCLCGKEFAPHGQPVASISGSIMGDEQVESYFFCGNCGVYTVEVYYDQFLNEDEVTLRGPVSKEEGDRKVALIRECPEPWDKKCRCPAHKEYFEGWLEGAIS